MSFLTVPLIIILIYFAFKYITQKQDSLENIPEPPGKFLIGHGLEIRNTTDMLRVFSKFIADCGPIVKLRLPMIATGLLTTDLKFTEFVLGSNQILEKSQNYRFSAPWLGSVLLIADAPTWKKHRTILTKSFHFETLKQFVETMESVGNIFIGKLNKFDGFLCVDLLPIVKLCTLDVICETVMGVKTNVQEGDNFEYATCVHEMCRILSDRNISPIKVLNWTFSLTRDFYLQKKLLKILHSFTAGVIKTKRKEMKRENGLVGTKMALLDLMLDYSKEENALSYKQIGHEVDTFMFAGHDTTAVGICFTLYCLANHKDVHNKVFKEQQDLFGNEKNPTVSYEDLQNMKYLELVIKESMRLYPPVPMIGRLTDKEVKFDRFTIPKNINICVFIYGIHRNPDYFPEPEIFNPDRFAEFDGSLPYAYIPFSAGPRNCIGQKFALLEMKSIIAKVIRHFEVKPASPKHDLIVAAEAVLTSANGIRVGIERRN